MITKQEESTGYLFSVEKKHKNHPAMGPKDGDKKPTAEDNMDLIGLPKTDRYNALKERFPGMTTIEAMKLSVRIDENATGTRGVKPLGLSQPSVVPPNWQRYNEVSDKLRARKIKL